MQHLFVCTRSAFNHGVLIEKAAKSGPHPYTINLEMIGLCRIPGAGFLAATRGGVEGGCHGGQL